MNLQTHPLRIRRAGTRLLRPLLWPLAFSLVAHGLLLWPSGARTARALLHASLRPGTVSLSVATAAPVVESPRLDPPLAARPTQSVPRAMAKAANKLAPRPKAPSIAPAAPTTEGGAAAVRVDSADSVAAVDADGLRSYRLALAVNARRFHHYPAQALEDGLAGTAQVRISFAPNGLLGSVDLTRSSGHDVLDVEARQMLARAARATLLPEALRAHAFAVDMPVEFVLPAR